ncbi:glycoside hydrolase family 16 protein [Sphingobacterium sp. 1.A.5]|jgi:beta-glucanase (GH16 family)|uniref:glycoside hydrolase family 16 protein n=1 Tax=Sphingobacterium sp. 1.A.5 TaxID=2044604 RepID=UPI000C0C02C6|nr:glycoside hydrolase family 16 protein [Sphingobacterium sp. 1.A.5]
MKITNILISGFAASLLLSACSVSQKLSEKPYVIVQKEGREAKKWKLVWEDDFDGNEIDSTKWSRIPKGESDWNKHMSTVDDVFRLEHGSLYLRGINNPDTTKDPRPFITGGIWSKNKFAFQYGRIEIRAKLGSAQGAWPAMWMLAELDKYGKYPLNGEIDIMEHLNYDTIIYQTTHSHYTLNLGQKDNPPHGGTATVNPNEYNVYGLSWYPDKIVFQLNGKDTFTYPRVDGVDKSQWPYDQPFFILIDQQLGGKWVGKVDQSELPVEMEIDWVKVYQ